MSEQRWKRFAQLTKFDGFTGEFEAVLTDETVDGVGEIMDYASSKPHFEAWSDFFAKATDGQSVGNLRVMHTLKSAGIFTKITFDDTNRRIIVGGRIVDTEEKKKASEGCYTGLSIGGDYEKRWADPEQPAHLRYTAIPVEGSLVDYPCNRNARFTYIRAAGAQPVMMKFKPVTKTYESVADLPESQVKDYSAHQKEIFRASFNSAYDATCKDREDRESCAFAIAHAAAQKAAEFGDLTKGTRVDMSQFSDEAIARLREKVQKSHWPVSALASMADQLEWCAQSAAAMEHPDVAEKLEGLRGDVLAVLQQAAAEEAAEHSTDEDDMDAEKARKTEAALKAIGSQLAELGEPPLSKADPNAHAEVKAKHHDALSDIHQKLSDLHGAMADHYEGGAKAAHVEIDEKDKKPKKDSEDADEPAEKVAKALAGKFVTPEDLTAFGQALIRTLMGGAERVPPKTPARADPAMLKGQGGVEKDEHKDGLQLEKRQTGDQRMDEKLNDDPTVRFIRSRMAQPMVFRTIEELGYRNRDVNRAR